jgi:hypothetical protein
MRFRDASVIVITEAPRLLGYPPHELVRVSHMFLGERLFVLIVIGTGLAATVGMWLFGLLIAGGINLF